MRSVIAVVLLVSCTSVATPAPSATATATATSAPSSVAPSASPTPTATADASRYGVLLSQAGRMSVRSETAFGSSIYATGGEHPVASHDGRKIAFWRTGPQGGNPHELRVAELPSGVERTLLTLPAGLAGGDIVWSSADDGLLYEVNSLDHFPGAGGGPRSSRIESYDLTATQAPGASDAGLMTTDGRIFVPLAWDRTGQMCSALMTGEGGMAIEYVTWDRRTLPPGQSATKRTRFPWPVVAFTVKASHDAKRLLAIDLELNGVRIWPIADIGAGDPVRANGTVTGARWRSGVPNDVAWVVGRNVEVFTYGTSNVAIWFEGSGGVAIMSWRVDGSGLVLFEPNRGTFVVPGPKQPPLPLFDQDAGVVGGVLLR